MQSWKWNLLGAGLLLAAATLTTVAEDKKPAKPATEQPAAPAAPAKDATGAKVGAAAPDFTLTDCTGKKFTLAELKDKIVVLEWLNQGCPWSVKARPICAELATKHAAKGVVWVGVDSTYGATADADKKYAEETKLPYAILMDSDGKVGHLFGATNTPHLFVINKGKLVYAGALNNNQQDDKPAAEVRQYVDEALTAVLAGKDVPLAETKPWGCPVKYQKK